MVAGSLTARASTGCDAANAGSFDQSAFVLGIDLNFGGDFEAGETLHFETNADTALFVLSRIAIPSNIELFTWVGADSADYAITVTETITFNAVLTGLVLNPAILTVTRTAAPDEEGSGDGEGSETATAANRVDRLFFAANEAEFGFDDATVASANPLLDSRRLRRHFLERQLTAVDNKVVALDLLHGVSPDDKTVAGWLADALAWRERLRVELGQPAALPPRSVPPLAFAETGVSDPVTAFDKPAAALTGGDGRMTLRFNPAPGFSTSIAYKEFDRDGADGLGGTTVTAIQEVSIAPTANLTGGLFAKARYVDVTSNDGLDEVESFTYGFGANAALAVGDGLMLRGAALYELGDNRASIDGATGDFGSHRFVGIGELAGAYWRGPWLFSPDATIRYEETRRDAYTDGNDEEVEAGNQKLGRLTVGGDLTRSFAVPTRDRIVTIHPFLRAKVSWDFLNEGSLSDDVVSLFDEGTIIYRTGGGLRLFWSDQASLLLSGEYFFSDDSDGFHLVSELDLPFRLRGSDATGNLRLAAAADQTGAVTASGRAIVPIN